MNKTKLIQYLSLLERDYQLDNSFHHATAIRALAESLETTSIDNLIKILK